MTDDDDRTDELPVDPQTCGCAICNLSARVTALEHDVSQVRAAANRHICQPHPSQTELATLRIILRSVSDRLAHFETLAAREQKGTDHAQG